MSWIQQLITLCGLMLVVAAFALWQRTRLENVELGKFMPPEQDSEETNGAGPRRPANQGILMTCILFLLHWHSLLSFNNHFRRDVVKHCRFIDAYALAALSLVCWAAFAQVGPQVWLFAVWRISCISIHVLRVGIFRDSLRRMRGDVMPASNPRIVLIGLMNWAELVALFALIYSTIRGGGRWLYESFTTQVTMGHSDRLRINEPLGVGNRISDIEKLAVVAQISISLCLITTLIGMYVGSLSSTAQAQQGAA